MKVRSGYLELVRVWGAPIRLHWSVPLGAVVFTGLRFAPGAWLGFVLLILVHELGHAVTVVCSRQRVVSVEVLGVGGLCRFDGEPTAGQRVLIAWGGVLGQAVLGVATLVAVACLGPPSRPFEAGLVEAFTRINLDLALLNLLPVPPLDGAEAWGVLKLLAATRARWRMRRIAPRTRDNPASARVLGARPAARPGPAVDLGEPASSELAPMPEEVKRVLDRIMAEGRAQHEGEKKK